MDIKRVSFWLEVKTKKARDELPTDGRCEIRASIGELGTVSLDLWARDGGSAFASINLSDPVEMKALASLLNAVAEASILQDSQRLAKTTAA